MTPREATTDEQRYKLGRDNVSTDGSWLLLKGDSITIANQRPGETLTGVVELTREEFETFIDWYNTGEYDGE